MNTIFRRSGIGAHALATIVASIAPAWADPQGGKIVSGSGTIRQASGATFVTQTSPNLSLSWSSFNLDPGQRIVFAQPDSRAIALNRVSGLEPSRIFGQINANGQVFLINPNGILFGRDAQANVGGLVASSHDISDADFAARRFRFENSGRSGSIVNQGQLSANDGGSISLLGQRVSNQGVIGARLGQVTLASGQAITLDLFGDGLISIAPDRSGMQALVDNSGKIQANGGQVWLSAQSASTLLRSVVNQDGVIEATSLPGRAGKIRLDAGAQGVVQVNGSLLAQGGKQGGELRLLGDVVSLGAQARLDVSGQSAGGRIELAGKTHLDLNGSLALGAAQGKSGSLLLESGNLYLVDDARASVGGNSGGNSGGNISTIAVGKLAGIGNADMVLQGSNSLVVGDAAGVGATLNLIGLSSNTLTLKAGNGAGGSGNVVFNPGSMISTGGGNLSIIAGQPGDLHGNAVLGRIALGSGSLTLAARGNITQTEPSAPATTAFANPSVGISADTLNVNNSGGSTNLASWPNAINHLGTINSTAGDFLFDGSAASQGFRLLGSIDVGKYAAELTAFGKAIDFGTATISAAKFSASSSAVSLRSAVFNIGNSLTLNSDQPALRLGAADPGSGTEYALSQADIGNLRSSAIPNIAITTWGGPMTLAGPLNLAGSKLDLSADSFSDGNTQNHPITANSISFHTRRGDLGASGENNAIDVLTGQLTLYGYNNNNAYIKAAPGALQLLRAELGSGMLALEAAGTLTQTGPLVAGKLSLVNHAGATNLGSANNHIAAIDEIRQSGGMLLLRNQADNLLLGPITADAGVAIYNSGSITVNRALVAGNGSLSLVASGSTADIVLNAGVKAIPPGGGMITLSAGGNFINHADALAVNPGLGNFVIFSTRPDQNVTDGILPGFVRYGLPQNGSVSQSGNGFVYSQGLPLPTNGASLPPGHGAALPHAVPPDNANTITAAPASLKGGSKNTAAVAKANKAGPQLPAASTPAPTAAMPPAVLPGNAAAQLAGRDNPRRAHLAKNPQAFKSAMKKLRAEEAVIYREAIAILQKNPHVADLPRCSKHSGRACIPRPVDLSHLPLNGQIDIKRRVAYLIGNNDYSGKIAKLTTPINDVNEIGQILQQKFGYEVHILTNASREQMIALLKSLSENHQPDESVLLFYAGHGKLVGKTKMAYWIPVDASSYRPDSWLSNSDINHFLAAIPAKQIMLVSDSCYSGTLVRELNLSYAKSLKREQILARRSVTVISSGGEELVSDAGKEEHSIFAWNFIEQLRQTTGNTVGVALFEKVSQGVRAEYPQRPRYGTALNAGHMGGDFLLDLKTVPEP